MDDILAGDQGILLLKWRQRWRGLQRRLLDLNHTPSTAHLLSHNTPELQMFGIVGQLPHNLGHPCPKASRLQVPSSPQQEMGKQ